MTEVKDLTLYNGEVLIKFWPNSHRYKIAEEKGYLPSVTSITGKLDKSRALIKWAVGLTTGYLRQFIEVQSGPYHIEMLMPAIDEAARQHEIVKDAAADTGSLVHEWVEKFIYAIEIKEPVPEVPEITNDESEKVVKGINAFLDWYNSNKIQFLKTETIVYSKKHGYIGKFDAIAMVNGVKTLIDFKTSSGVYSEQYYQLAAYWQAHDEEFGEGSIEQGLILHCSKKDGNFGVYPVTKEVYRLDVEAFNGLVQVAKREKVRDAEYRASQKEKLEEETV